MRATLLPLLLGCHGAKTAEPGPCADGSWSGWSSPDDLVIVSATGDDERGRGTPELPYRGLDAALADDTREGPLAIALGPGSFDGGQVLSAIGGREVTVQGCSAEETEIRGQAASGFGDEALVVGGYAGDGAVDRLTLRHLAITSNGPGVVARKHSALSLEDVALRDTHRFAVGAIGDTTTLALEDVRIDTVGRGAHGGLVGWGVLVTGATATLERVSIEGTRAMGLYQRGGRLSATELTVSGVADTSGEGLKRRGFGVHVDAAAQVALERCTIRAVAGGGILLVDVLEARVSGCTVDGVDPTSEEPGDGLLVARRVSEVTPRVTLSDNTVRGARRMGIVLAGVEATLMGNVAGADNGLSEAGSSLYADALAVVSGATPILFDRAELRLLRASGRRSDRARSGAP